MEQSNLERLLHERADSKLRNYLRGLVDKIPNGQTADNVIKWDIRLSFTAPKEQTEITRNVNISEIKDEYQKQMFEHMRNDWRKREVEEHLKLVDSLQEQIDHLKDDLNNVTGH